MKPNNPEEFSERLVSNFTWRLKEISDIRALARVEQGSFAATARRASIPLIYAHWEGYVAFVTQSYLEYITTRKFEFSSLIPSLQAAHLAQSMPRWQLQRDSISLRLEIITTIHDIQQTKFKKIPKSAINTGGNLNFERFTDICRLLNVDEKK
jgi:hypothetical protein